MKTANKIFSISSVLLLIVLLSAVVFATDYYVKNGGSDSANGLSDGTAWATIQKVNSVDFNAGDSVYFNKGDIWRTPDSNLTVGIEDSGEAGNPFTIGAYGTGALPKVWSSLDGNTLSWANTSGTIYRTSVTADPITVLMNGVALTGVDGNYASLTSNQWDYDTGYVYVNVGVDPSDQNIEIPNHDHVVVINADANYVAIQNLDLRYARYDVWLANGGRSHDINVANIYGSGTGNDIFEFDGNGTASFTNITTTQALDDGFTMHNRAVVWIYDSNFSDTVNGINDIGGSTAYIYNSDFVNNSATGISLNGSTSGDAPTKHWVYNSRFSGTSMTALDAYGNDANFIVQDLNFIGVKHIFNRRTYIGNDNNRSHLYGTNMYSAAGMDDQFTEAATTDGFVEISDSNFTDMAVASAYYFNLINGYWDLNSVSIDNNSQLNYTAYAAISTDNNVVLTLTDVNINRIAAGLFLNDESDVIGNNVRITNTVLQGIRSFDDGAASKTLKFTNLTVQNINGSTSHGIDLANITADFNNLVIYGVNGLSTRYALLLRAGTSTKVYNSLITKAPRAIYIDGNLTLYDSLIYNTPIVFNIVDASDLANFTLSHNNVNTYTTLCSGSCTGFTNANGFSLSPGFTDWDTNNFTLTSASSLIDIGLDINMTQDSTGTYYYNAPPVGPFDWYPDPPVIYLPAASSTLTASADYNCWTDDKNGTLVYDVNVINRDTNQFALSLETAGDGSGSFDTGLLANGTYSIACTARDSGSIGLFTTSFDNNSDYSFDTDNYSAPSFSGFTCDKTTMSYSDSLTAAFTLSNLGTAAADFTINAASSNLTLSSGASSSVNNISAGSSENFSYVFTGSADACGEGSMSFNAFSDDTNQVSESCTVTITGCPTPGAGGIIVRRTPSGTTSEDNGSTTPDATSENDASNDSADGETITAENPDSNTSISHNNDSGDGSTGNESGNSNNGQVQENPQEFNLSALPILPVLLPLSIIVAVFLAVKIFIKK